MGTGENENNQWKWEGNGNKMTLNPGSVMEMGINLCEWGGNGINKVIPAHL